MKKVRLSIVLWLFTANCFGQLAAPNAEGLRFGHVHLNVSDVAAHTEIWTQYFGGEVVVKDQLIAIKFENMLLFLNSQIPISGSRETVMDHFGFKVRNMDAFLASLSPLGLETGNLFVGAEGQNNVYVTLPDGVYVELQEDQGLSKEVSGYHVHFYSPTPEILLNWYTDLFDIEVRPRGSIATTTNVPGHNLSFARSNAQRNPTRGSSIDHIGFEIDDLAAFVKGAEDRGYVFTGPINAMTGSTIKSAFLTDLDGTLIEVTEGLADF